MSRKKDHAQKAPSEGGLSNRELALITRRAKKLFDVEIESQHLRPAIAQLKSLASESRDDPHAHLESLVMQLAGMAPKSPLELLLGVQILSVHIAALSYMANAKMGGEQSDRDLLRATTLMKVFADQLEVMLMLKLRWPPL